jgi:hypothetical protein
MENLKITREGQYFRATITMPKLYTYTTGLCVSEVEAVCKLENDLGVDLSGEIEFLACQPGGGAEFCRVVLGGRQ